MQKKQTPRYKYIHVAGRMGFARCAIRSFSDEQRSTTSVTADESTRTLEMDAKEEGGRFTIRRVKHGLEPEKISFSYRSTNEPTHVGDGGEYAEWQAEDSHGLLFKAQEENDHDLDGNQPGKTWIPWEESEDMEPEDMGLEEPYMESADEYHSPYQENNEIENLIKNGRHQGRTSTITPSERAAFQKIFSDIFARSRPFSPHGMDGLLEEEELQGLDLNGGRAEQARAKVNDIINVAAQNRSRKEIEATVNRYPPALRPAAARAMGLTSKNRGPAPAYVDDRLAGYIQAEKLRGPERKRVESLMRSAATDLDLWAIMQEEVFSLISKLGLKEAVEEETPSKKSAKKASSDLEGLPQHNSQQTHASLDTPVDGMSPLEVYGPLYPAYLLLGLRLLDRSFARPSPLTLAVLPAIKSLGIISHVLGGSTQLYNELLLIHWYRHDDFRGVIKLLMEMEDLGLDWNADTLKTIDYIYRAQTVIRRGERGLALKALYKLPEFAAEKFLFWRNKIAQSLEGPS
jgi:hypothetical protein